MKHATQKRSDKKQETKVMKSKSRKLTVMLATLATTVTPWLQVSAAPVGHWKLDETSGNTAFDSSGNDYHGSFGDSVILGEPGAFSGSTAFDFSDASGAVVADLGTDLPTGNSPRTITAWVQVSGGDLGDRKFMGYGVGQFGKRFDFTVELENSDPVVKFRHNGGNISFDGAVLDEWFHFATVVPDSATTTDDVLVYINGQQRTGTRMVGSNQTLDTGDSDFRIGGPDDFKGLVDDVQFYDQALSSSQVQYLYDNPGAVIPEPSTLALLGLAASILFLRRKG